MSAIDFTQLLRQERKRVKQKKADPSVIPIVADDDDDASQQRKTERKWKSPSTTHTFPTLCRNRHRVVDNFSIYYIQNFVSLEWQENLVYWLQGLPGRPSQNDTPQAAHGRWTQLKTRRVALWDDQVGDLPEPLEQLCQKLVECGIFHEQPPNHVLVNDYPPHVGIFAHGDGPAYEPRTATLSLGASHVPLEFEPNGPRFRLDNLSLLVFEEEAYRDYTHSIPDGHEGGDRISLTFRILKR